MIDWRCVPIRTLAVWFSVSFGAFVLSCYLIYAWHAEISQSKIATYAVLGLAGVSVFAWPIFAVRLLRASVGALWKRKSVRRPG